MATCYFSKIHQHYGWAVRSGQVAAAVPIPATGWLVAVGLMLLSGIRMGRRLW